MKKFLIAIAPFVILLFLFMLFLWGLKSTLEFFCVLLFNVALIFGSYKWWEFADEYIKEHIED